MGRTPHGSSRQTARTRGTPRLLGRGHAHPHARPLGPPCLRSLPRCHVFYFNERAFGIVDVLVAAAREAGCTPAQLALAWQLEKPEITSVIIGARNLAQLEDNLGAAVVHVSPEIMTRLEDATRIAPEYPGVFIDFIQTWLGNR